MTTTNTTRPARRTGSTLLLALVVAVASLAGAVGPAGAAEAPAPPPNPSIVGGTVAPPGAWQTQVALIDRAAPSTSAGQFCGGTVIDRSWILTAAHCVLDPPDWRPRPSDVDVLVGTQDLSAGGTRIRAMEFRVHPGWDRDILRNDVALIRLDRPVPNGTPIQALATAADGAAGTDGTAVGWGALNDAATQFPNALRQVTMEIGSDAQCAPYVGPIFHAPTQTCSWAPGRGACYGDSGGPLMAQRDDATWAQVGISSYVLTCGVEPTYFTQVSAYATWIRWQIRYGPHPNATRFVERQHLDLFGRPPTNTELFFGVAALEDGQSTAAYVAGLLDGTFRTRAGGVIRLYEAIFLREPESAGLTFWMGELNRGVSLRRIADLMVRAPEFTTLYGALDDEGFVDLVYGNVLGREPSAGESTYWVDELASGRRTRGAVMVGFSESPEYRGLTDPTTRVTAAFWALVRRVPTTAEMGQWTGRPTGDIARFLLTSYTYALRF